MLFPPKPLGKGSLPADVIQADVKQAVKYGSCAFSEKALYVGGFLKSNSHYVPLPQVERVFKRLAVTKGFFEQGKMFASIPYLVVVYDGGREKQCRFDNEEQLNLLLKVIRERTEIPVGKA